MKEVKQDLNLDFINLPETISELGMEEIRGGREVGAYMACGEHHSGTEQDSRLMTLI